MRKLIIAPLVLLVLLLTINAFGQDASLGGTVVDATEAILPGVTVTATNEATGIESTAFTNDSGVYSFPRLQIGVYTVKAELDGFQPKIVTDVTLSLGQQARLNFELEVSGLETSIAVTTSGEELLLESSSTVGDVLAQETVEELPLVNRDAMDLIKVMSGVIVADDPIFGAANTSFAGVSAQAVNVQRDGVTVNGVRFLTGVNTPTRVNPDLVGEFQMVLAPVDAEVGRGNAQVRIVTKSGGNDFHGSAVWNIQNSSLDPNTWDNNRTDKVPPWRNLQEGTVSVSGPIVKNKTFFFALFNFQIAKTREPYNAMTLTPCAQRGIFRFWDRWNNANADYREPTAIASSNTSLPTVASVDYLGNPVRPQWEPGGWGTVPYTGQLRYASVFGTIDNIPDLLPDCSNAVISGGWDPLRTGMDPSGFIDDFIGKLNENAPANNYLAGDGLNTAGHLWTRTSEGSVNLWGIGEDQYRKSINIRIDHNFSNNHRINGSWSFEKNRADDTPRTWPTNSWDGGGISKPQVLSLNFTSTISPTLLNEAKFGMSRTGSNIYPPQSRPGNGDTLQQYLEQFGTLRNGEVGVVEPGVSTGNFGWFRTDGGSAFGGGEPHLSTPYGTRGGWAIADLFDTSPRYSIGDTMTWVRGAHSFRFGGEWRRQNSHSRGAWLFNPSNFQWGDSFPEYQGGELPQTPNTFDHVVGDLAGNAGNDGNQRAMRDLLIFLSGSLSQIKQVRYINSREATDWNNPVEEPHMVRNTIMKEFSLFFKDDWKIRPDLTLNLGLRWDYFGVPYLDNGMTVGLEGGGSAIFGPTDNYDNWFAPIERGDEATGSLVTLQSIGPGGENSGIPLYPKTYTNFGPALGFAYEVPWLGQGRTTIRGGWQRSYISMAGNFQYVEAAAGSSPGFFNINNWNNNGTWADGEYFGIKDLANNPLFDNGVPIPDNVVPGLTTFDLYDRQQSVSAYRSDYGYPYVDNLTFAITHNLTSNLTVDARYIGTLTRKNFSSKDINITNFLSNGLLDAFDEARAGGNPVLLDQLLDGVGWPLGCTVDGTTCTGGEALRTASSPNYNVPLFAPGWFTNLDSMLANGNYQGLANALNTLTRISVPGDDRGAYMEDNGFPVNFIKASPQFHTATLYENEGYSNYHSFQAQVTLRPYHGLYLRSTYTLSKNLGYNGGLSPDPRNYSTGYILLDSDRTHNWVTYGNYDLPFGPNRLVGSETKGVLAKIIEGWQLGWITSITSGNPLTVTANCGLYANCTPDEVNGGIDPASVGTTWQHGASTGSFFGDRYTFTQDPQCNDASIVDPSLAPLCTLQAAVDSTNDTVVLQNPLPGFSGNMRYNNYRNQTRWNADMSFSKSVALDETKSFRVRVDISNLFNHPFASGTPGEAGRVQFPTNPSMGLNGGAPLGQYTYKVGTRTIQAMLRFDF